MASKIIGLVLGYFGYTKVPLAAVQLAGWIKGEVARESPDLARIQAAAASLEKLFRSARRVGK